ncbi:hypothetical protein [Haloarchaeobius sp. DFWS5]|uniref:hypothetical protein n=1 Tax=Haloarchaeobius sp. DFWS5 TaxID=3446114 RepID=UPI003EBD76D3
MSMVTELAHEYQLLVQGTGDGDAVRRGNIRQLLLERGHKASCIESAEDELLQGGYLRSAGLLGQKLNIRRNI